MNVWKKSLSLALALLLALSLTACGGKTAEKAPRSRDPGSH